MNHNPQKIPRVSPYEIWYNVPPAADIADNIAPPIRKARPNFSMFSDRRYGPGPLRKFFGITVN
jgi:hypothetical protein